MVSDDISNEFVNDVGQEHGDSDQGQPTNVRRSAREPVPSTRYLSSEYVTITECGEPENFGEFKAHLFVLGNNHLCNSFAVFHDERLVREVHQ